MTEQTQPEYDVFISYAGADHAWVWDELLPRLEKAGLSVIIDERDFAPGAPLVAEKERAALQSRKTVMVLSPAYLASEWTEFENILVQTLDPAARKRRLIPVLQAPCRPNLRIRPLVSVDLTADNDLQWQRLLKALDPLQPPATNPIQNLTLAVTESTSGLAAPGWHPLGSVWLALGLLGLILLIGLVYLLLYKWPALRETASVMGAALLTALGFLGLREDRDFFQRLSHFLGQARVGQAGMASILAAALLLWGFAGWPRLQEVMVGPLGPRSAGVQRYAIGEWKNLTPGRSEFEGVWTEGTRRALYQKLSTVDALQGIGVESSETADAARRELDLWIDGDYRKITNVTLSAAIANRGGAYLGTVAVQREVDETSADREEAAILSAQDALARKIIDALQVKLQPSGVDPIGEIPTRSAQALRLNNEAALLIDQGVDLDRAETLLRAALDLDPGYADAHNNLGRLLRNRGDLAGAIEEYRQATQLLPRYPIFHFNLGLAYDRAGELEAAIGAYQRALELDPAYVSAINNLAFVYLELGRLDEAAELLQRGLKLQPDAAYLHKNLGRVRLEQGHTGDAIAELDQAIQLSDVPYAEAMFYLARAYSKSGQIGKACALLAQYAGVAEADAADDPSRPAVAKGLAAELQCP
jgi:tetratricopeptide (TPR) repeat protein